MYLSPVNIFPQRDEGALVEIFPRGVGFTCQYFPPEGLGAPVKFFSRGVGCTCQYFTLEGWGVHLWTNMNNVNVSF